MENLLPLSIALVAVLALAWWLLRRRGRSEVEIAASDRSDTLAGWPPATTQILRTSERIAYSTLRLALPGYMLLAQVPIARFITVPKRNSYAEWMRRLGSQCVDLVVCDVTSQVVAVVEIRPSNAQLTDAVRRRLARVSRVLEAVGIPLHVWNQDSLPSVDAVRASLAPKMPAVPLELAARRVAAQTAAPTIDEGQNPFEDTDRTWTPDEGIEVTEVREPTASTWFDELDSVPATLPPPSSGTPYRS
jgi:hypothetical protein